MTASRHRTFYSGARAIALRPGRGAPSGGRTGRYSTASAAARRRASLAGSATLTSAIRRKLASRWGVTTSLALMAVFFIFVDSLLTVEIQRVSLEAHDLRKNIQTVSMELGALESIWASKSSHVEVDSKAALLGLSVPEPDQVVLLPPGFMEDEATVGPFAGGELRHEFLSIWTRAVAMGIP